MPLSLSCMLKSSQVSDLHGVEVSLVKTAQTIDTREKLQTGYKQRLYCPKLLCSFSLYPVYLKVHQFVIACSVISANNLLSGIFLLMPGANCSIYGCNTARNHKGIAIFKVPSQIDELSTRRRNKLVHIATKDHVIEKSLRKQIDE